MKPFARIAALAIAALSHAALAQEDAMPPAPRGALAPKAVFAQLGRASETTSVTIGALWDFNRHWKIGTHGLATAYGELSLGHWRADQGGGSAIVTQVGFTPTLRYWPSGAPGGWFAEGAIGFDMLTPLYRTREKRFSTAFNFGDHVGIGYRMQEGRHWEWLLRVEHFSNAGIDTPNPGENFVQLRVVVPMEQSDS